MEHINIAGVNYYVKKEVDQKISELQEKLLNQKGVILILEDKISRRNLQIADLKKKIASLKNALEHANPNSVLL